MNICWRLVATVLLGMMSFVLCTSAAWAQQRAIINPSFEANDPPGSPNYLIYTNGSVDGWNTTTGYIELWDSGFLGITAQTGNGDVFAEMNAYNPGALFQTICMVNGETIGWSFWHRARSGGPDPQTASFQIADQHNSNTGVFTNANQSTTVAQGWIENAGSITYTGPSGMRRVQFKTTDPGSYGNLLDNIRIYLNPFVEFKASASSGIESIANANIPSLVVSGSVFAATNVTVTITGGSAIRGTDYTTPGGTATFTVTIPAGVHQGTLIPLGINITNDAIIEGSETIIMAISPGSGYTRSGTQSCGATAVSSATYTITDDDAAVTLTKNWVNGRANDVVSLNIAGAAITTAGSSSAGGSANNATATAAQGTSLIFTEAYTTGAAANYITTFECRRNSDNVIVSPSSGSGLSYTVTVPTGSAMTCIFTNTRRSAALTIRKTWANAKLNDSVTMTTTGLQNNPTLVAVANAANDTDSLTAVTVYAAESATFSEAYTIGNAANYTPTLTCTGNTTALSGSTLTVNGADTAIICTYTNTRKSAQLQLRKTWVNATLNDAVTLPATTGFTANTAAYSSVANTVSETDTGTAVTVYAGDVGTVQAESFTTGVPSNYQSVLGCSGGTLSGTNAQASNSLTINAADAGTTVLCTYTNSRVTILTVTKTSSVTADGVSASNPKAIPASRIRYCVLITNPGPSTATTVSATDALPTNMTYFPDSLRSGTTCANATNYEDGDATGADENDPFGISISGSTITGIASTLAVSGSFAMAFEATIN